MPPRMPGPPQILNGQVIPPRQPGETKYAYRKRRSLALFGQTPYERRKQRGLARGLTVQEARGHVPPSGQTEYQARRERTISLTGITPSQLAWAYARNWLISQGFSPETTGASWTYLHQMEPSLRQTWDRAIAVVGPDEIRESVELEKDNNLERGWTLIRLRNKLISMINYQDYRNNQPGNMYWTTEYIPIHPYLPQLAVEFWYYH